MRRFELPAVVALAAALRLLMLLLWSPELSGDAVDYDRLARSLVEGRGYVNPMGEPTSWRPPLYPAFVATGYLLSSGSIQGVRVLQAVLDLGTVTCTYIIGRSLFGRNSGLIAALLVALNLGTVAATGRLLSETLFTFLLLAGTAVSDRWLRAVRGGRSTAAVVLGIGAGALLAGGTLTRGILLLYPIVLVAVAAVFRPSKPRAEQAPSVSGCCWRATSLGSLALLSAFALILTPWVLRNYRVHGAFVPVATQVGMTLYGSYNPPRGWIFGILPQDSTTAAAERLPEPEASAALVRGALGSIRAFPLRTLKLEGLKILYFWAPFDWEILPFYGAFNPTYAFVALWALMYLAFYFRRGSVLTTAAVWLPILYLFGMALIFYGSPRFRLPAEPLLALFAAAQLVAVDRRVGRRTAVALVVATASFLLIVSIVAGPIKLFFRERFFVSWKSSDVSSTTGTAHISCYGIVEAIAKSTTGWPCELAIGASGAGKRSGDS
jgi:4-amino-4-deoxy-L-arabinose transferase-like glycosyltransferase